MRLERFIVYRLTDPETSERVEERGFREDWAAREWAEQQARRTGATYSIDWQAEEITRAGREILDTDADLYWVTP